MRSEEEKPSMPQKILVVDDSDLCRDLTRMMLEDHGYQVVTMESGLGLSRALGREKPDLVLLDVSMPALSGNQVVEVTRQHRLHRCPIVLFSDRPASELSILARDCGAAGFIAKTSNAAALAQLVGRFLAGGVR
jgi:two-component system sensor histidine kinase ChiS